MKVDNFLRTFHIGDIPYIVTARPASFKQDVGTPKYYIQVWKMTKLTAGKLYTPNIRGWAVPSLHGYAIRSMNLDVAYERFLEDFKYSEINKVSKVTT